MNQTLESVRVGAPLRHEALTVFPLYSDSDPVDYLLADEALSNELLVVEEVSESGSVPELLVDNRSDMRVLLIEGQELEGAKQNRVVNTSILVPAKTRLKIPVSCVEQGRWHYRSRKFRSSGNYASSRVRNSLKKSVTKSLRTDKKHLSNQGAVWSSVEGTLSSNQISSSTNAMSEAYGCSVERLKDYTDALKCPADAKGIAVVVGDRLVALDVFDNPKTCSKVWGSLVSATAIDAQSTATPSDDPEASLVEKALTDAAEAAWEPVEPVGDGEESRASIDEDEASALSLDGTLVHASVTLN